MKFEVLSVVSPYLLRQPHTLDICEFYLHAKVQLVFNSITSRNIGSAVLVSLVVRRLSGFI